jgi:uncharacterized membrane protein
MRVRTLKTILAVSVAVNVFALAGAGAYAVSRAQVERRVEDQRGPGRHQAFAEVLAGLDTATRDDARQRMRRSALAAKPDFEAARNARREAIDVAGRPTLDEPRVRTLLEQSRAAEMRGRARLENDAVAILATLNPEDRKALTPILRRKGDGRRAVAGRDE